VELAKGIPSVQAELEGRIEALGLELVDAEWAGSAKRPILRIRVDRPDAGPGEGVTVDDCAAASRGLEPWLDEHPDVPERYVLEVSSPGIERPLVRTRDWVRFRGEEIVVVGRASLGEAGTRIEGVLEAVDGEAEPVVATVRLASGEGVTFSLDEVKRAHLLYRWE
jgi:ribosome maturation factor RimP